MGTKVFTALLCGLAMAGQMRAQEVVVARETKPSEHRRVAASDRSGSESANATATKTRVHAKKSASTLPTVEQMRLAGALAVERLKNRTPIEATNIRRESSSQTPKSETLPTESVRKEKRVEQSSAPGRSKSGKTKLEPVAPVRPTMIESGKEETDTSQPGQSESRGGQTSGPESTDRFQLLNKSAREPDANSAQS
jgi:hypothetical protein